MKKHCLYVALMFCVVLLKDNHNAVALELKSKEIDADELRWQPAIATWYGNPEGDGSNGGACGYGHLVDVKPLKARVGAVSPLLFKGGEGCGECYKIKCTGSSLCGERPVTVVITDECPGCSTAGTHFDLSGAAFGHMAIPGKSPQLRNAGEITVLYRRTPCVYPGKNITFHVKEGSTPYWFSFLIEYEDGDGDLASVLLKQKGREEWQEMRHLWGAVWCLEGGSSALQAPFSVRVRTLSTGKRLSVRDVIPVKWRPNATYKARLNFDP